VSVGAWVDFINVSHCESFRSYTGVSVCKLFHACGQMK
jgi:hypothetical protein